MKWKNNKEIIDYIHKHKNQYDLICRVSSNTNFHDEWFMYEQKKFPDERSVIEDLYYDKVCPMIYENKIILNPKRKIYEKQIVDLLTSELLKIKKPGTPEEVMESRMLGYKKTAQRKKLTENLLEQLGRS